MVSQENGHSWVMMTEKYANFNLIKLRYDFQSPKDRINLRITPSRRQVFQYAFKCYLEAKNGKEDTLLEDTLH